MSLTPLYVSLSSLSLYPQVSAALRVVQTKAPHQFYLGLIDLAALDKVPTTKRFLIEGCAALRIVLVTVPRVSRACEHFPDGFNLHLLLRKPGQ